MGHDFCQDFRIRALAHSQAMRLSHNGGLGNSRWVKTVDILTSCAPREVLEVHQSFLGQHVVCADSRQKGRRPTERGRGDMCRPQRSHGTRHIAFFSLPCMASVGCERHVSSCQELAESAYRIRPISLACLVSSLCCIYCLSSAGSASLSLSHCLPSSLSRCLVVRLSLCLSILLSLCLVVSVSLPPSLCRLRCSFLRPPFGNHL